MEGWLEQVVPPELHSWDLPCRSVPRAGLRAIPEEQTLDVNAHKPHLQCTQARAWHSPHQELGEPCPLSPVPSSLT